MMSDSIIKVMECKLFVLGVQILYAPPRLDHV